MRKMKRMACAILGILLCLLPVCAGAETLAADQQLNAYYTLMTLALSGADYETALTYADVCLEMEQMMDDTLRADIWLKRGYALMYLQRFDEAIESLDNCLAAAPGVSDAMLLKMQTYAAKGDAQGAMAQADEYLSAYPQQPEVYATLGELYAAGGNYDGAVEAYTKYIQTAEQVDVTAYEMRGQYLLQLGRYEESQADLTAAIDGAGEEAGARAYYLRAIARMQIGANAEAIEDLSVCVEYLDSQETEDGTYAEQVDADVLNSRYYRGIAAMQVGQYEMAIADFTDCVDRGLNDSYARFWRGACYMDSGEYALAIEDFASCQQAGIEEESCLYYTAMSYMGLQQYQEAVDGFTQCIEQGVMAGQALYNRGMCYIQMGETQKGQADLEQSVGLSSEDAAQEHSALPEVSEALPEAEPAEGE